MNFGGNYHNIFRLTRINLGPLDEVQSRLDKSLYGLAPVDDHGATNDKG